MDISNKTLALFLVGAIVISLGGTILSLNKLGSLSTTGMVTGNVSLQIGQTLSITTEDGDAIDFGTCSPSATGVSIINSENGEDTATACDPYTGNGIFVRNNGNVNANITISPSAVGAAHGGSFLDSSSDTSAVAFRTVNEGFSSFQGACTSGLVTSYTNLTQADTAVLACGNLGFGSVDNSMEVHLQLYIPSDVPEGDDSIELTFQAEALN